MSDYNLMTPLARVFMQAAKVMSRPGSTPSGERLLAACDWGSAAEVAQLLAGGAPVGFIGEGGRNGLHLASLRGHAPVVRLLLEKNSSLVDGVDDGRSSPLALAAMAGHDRVCAVLLDAGAAVNACDAAQRTPLARACESNQLSCVSVLLAAGADAQRGLGAALWNS